MFKNDFVFNEFDFCSKVPIGVGVQSTQYNV